MAARQGSNTKLAKARYGMDGKGGRDAAR
jgi:hypothetical protein